MQQELDALPPAMPITIFGVNLIGSEAGNLLVTASNDLPWLQDVPSENAQASWQAMTNEIYVLGPSNEVITVFPASLKPLSVPANYQELKDLLIAAAVHAGSG